MAYSNQLRSNDWLQTVIIGYQNIIKRVEKRQIVRSIFLLQKDWQLDPEQYQDAFDWMLRNIFRVSNIYLYDDGVIRLNTYRNEVGVWRCLLLEEGSVKDDRYNKELYDLLKKM